MKAEIEIWQLMTDDGVYQADLPTLKQWVAEGVVQPTDRVRKGGLNWIEAGRAPSLRRVFAGEEQPAEPAPQEAAGPAESQHAHAALGQAHAQASITQAAPAPAQTPTPTPTQVHAADDLAHAPQDLGLTAGPSPFGADAQNGFIEVVKDFPAAAPGVAAGAGAAFDYACMNHPADAATLICRECRETFCRACPNRMGTSSVMLCPSCGNFCDPLESIKERAQLYDRASSGFGMGDFKEALAYPLKHLGSLIGGALLYGFLLIVGLRGQLLAYGLVFGCISLVIHRVAYGHTERDFLPDFSAFSFWDDVIVPCFLGLGITIATLGPLLLLVALLFFGWVGGGAPKPSALAAAQQEAQRRQQAMTAEDMKVLTGGGTAGQEAELERKMKQQMSTGGRLSEQAEQSKRQDDTTLSLVRGLMSRGGLMLALVLLAVTWAAFYHPMALLVAGWTESFKATINPLVGIDTMRHMGSNYFKAFVMYLTVQTAAFVLEALVGFVTSPFDMPFVGNVPARFVGGVVTFYTSLVIACVLGLALFKSADRLGIELD
jgi:hypothetical protein